MREIKFRAWDKESKKMLQAVDFWELWKFNPTGIMATIEWSKNNLEVMQFTGLKDKRGKDIYEGDYLQVLPNGYEPREIFEVIWSEKNLQWEVIMVRDKFKLASPLSDFDKNCKVIGNIYEMKIL